jgi:hypothetical protein
MLHPVLLCLTIFGLATFCSRVLGHILLVLSWELYHLKMIPLTRIVCSLAKPFFAKGNPSNKIWVKEGITHLQDRSRTLQHEIDLLRMEMQKFREELEVRNRRIWSSGVLKALCERGDALGEGAEKISEKHRLYELDYARFIRDVRDRGVWATAYFFHEDI